MSSTTPEQLNEIVRAGAGSGKTTQLIDRIINFAVKYQSDHKRWPRIMATTFTIKSTQEIYERLMAKSFQQRSLNQELFEYFSSSQVNISTLDGAFSLFLRKYGYVCGIDPSFSVLSESEFEYLSKKVLRQMILSKNNLTLDLLKSYSFQDLISSLVSYSALFERNLDFKRCTLEDYNLLDEYFDLDYIEFLAKEERKKISDRKKVQISNVNIFLNHSEKFEELAKIFYDKLNLQKKEKNVLSMSDLANLSWKICLEKDSLAKSFSKEWDYWLIDEYQDTSFVQSEILKNLIGESPYYIVGDPQQSIYLFRGARSELFDKKEKEVALAEGKINFLKKNYRSKPALLNFINECFKESSQFQRMDPRSEALNIEEIFAKIILVEEQVEGVGGKSDGSQKSLERIEHLSIVTHIKNLVKTGVDYKDICILCRTKSNLYRISQALSEFKISNYAHVPSGFFKRREILDLLSLLKFFINTHDDLNLSVLLRSPWLRWPDDKIISSAQKKDRDQSLWDHIRLSNKEDDLILKLEEFYEKSKETGIYECFLNLVISLGYLDYSRFLDPTGKREANIWKFITLVQQKSKLQNFNYIDFLNECEKSHQSSRQEKEVLMEPDAKSSFDLQTVQLMTVHGSKGLEFKHIIIPNINKPLRHSGLGKPMISFDEEKGLWDIACPIEGSQKNTDQSLLGYKVDLDLKNREELEFERLLYVAMTRARESLCLTGVFPKNFEKSKSTSWLKLLSINLDKGVHKSSQFSYEVQRLSGCENFEYLKKYRTEDSQKIKNLKKIYKTKKESYFPDQKHSSYKRRSVTSLVEEEFLSISKDCRFKIENKEITPSLNNIFNKLKIERMSRGTNIHKIFEILKYSDSLSDSHLDSIFGKDTDRVKEAIKYVRSEPPLFNLIRDGYVEWGFCLKQDRQTDQDQEQEIISGQIDLWGKVDGEVWIVDYKTGSQEFLEKSFLQLQYYARALHQKFNFKDFHLAAVYPMDQEMKIRTFKI